MYPPRHSKFAEALNGNWQNEPICIANSTRLGSYRDLICGQHGVDLTAVLPDDKDGAIANGKSGTEQFGHFLGKRRGEGNRAPGDSPTLTGRASARYDRAVRELIAIRAGLGAKGAPRVALLNEPAVPGIGKSKQRSAALTPKRGREGSPMRVIGFAPAERIMTHRNRLCHPLCDGDCLWGAPSFSTGK